MLIHTRVGCGKKDFWFEARRKFLAHLQLNRSLPPACLSSAMLIFHGMLPHCFWELVSCAWCLVSAQDTKSPLLCGRTCVLLCDVEFHFVSGRHYCFCLLSILLSWWGQQFWFLFIPSNHPGINFYFPFICFHVRFTSFWSHQHSEVHTVAFFKYFSGVSAIYYVIEIHKYVSHEACSNVFSRLLATYILYSAFVICLPLPLNINMLPFYFVCSLQK